MAYLKKSVQKVMDDARAEIAHPSRNWKGKCQSFARTMYGVPAWSGSAIGAWNRIPAQHRHTHSGPEAAPRGALLYFRGGKYGHVMIAAGVRTKNKAIGTDYQRTGKVDYCPRRIPNWGNLTYVGWSAWTPFGELKVS